MLYITSIADLVSLKEEIKKLKITRNDTIAFIENSADSDITIPCQCLSYLLTNVRPQKTEFFAKGSAADMIALGALMSRFGKATVIGNPADFPDGMKNITRYGTKPKNNGTAGPKPTPVKPVIAKPADVKKAEPEVKATPAAKPAPAKLSAKKPGKDTKKKAPSASKEDAPDSFVTFLGIKPVTIGLNDDGKIQEAGKDLEKIVSASKDYLDFRRKVNERFGEHSSAIFMSCGASVKELKDKLQEYRERIR